MQVHQTRPKSHWEGNETVYKIEIYIAKIISATSFCKRQDRFANLWFIIFKTDTK